MWLEGGQEGRVMTQKHKKQTLLMINIGQAEENAGEDISSLNLLRTNTADQEKVGNSEVAEHRRRQQELVYRIHVQLPALVR